MTEEKTTIMVFHPYYSIIAGSEKVITEVAQVLEEKYNIIFVVPGEGSFTEFLRNSGFKVLVVTPPEILNLFGGQYFKFGFFKMIQYGKSYLQFNLKLAPIIKKYNCKLIIYNTSRAIIVFGLLHRLARIPGLYYEHGHQDKGGLLAKIIRLVLAVLPNYIIAVSSDALNKIGFNAITRKKSAIVNNWIDDFGSRYKNPSEQFTFGVVGNIVKRKGIHVLIEAFSQMDQSYKQRANILIAGQVYDNTYYLELKRQIESNGVGDKVKFVGFVNDVGKFLDQIDVFILPSFGEGQPRSILEAMIAEKPIIASKVEGVEDLLENGRHALTVEPGNAFALSKAMHLLISDSKFAAGLAKAARERALLMFSKDRQIDHILLIIDKLLNKTY